MGFFKIYFLSTTPPLGIQGSATPDRRTHHQPLIHCADTCHLHFNLNGKLGPRTTLGANTGSSQREGAMVMVTHILSLIADLAAVPQRIILKAFNSKYSYLTHLK